MSRLQPSSRRTPSLQGSPEPIAALNRVPIREYQHPWEERDPLVDIRSACPGVSLSDKLCPFLRSRPAGMLNQAQASLSPGYRLHVGTALRTLSMQKGGWDRYFDRMREEHPGWPLSALRRATNKYFAPYDQKAPPGHCTGGAVDVSLLDVNNQPLDLTAPTQGWEAAYTWSEKLAPEAKANRMMMVEAMLGAGFSNCRDEYWHYSWGDSAWAVRVGETECPYGWAHPPVCLEIDFPEASATDLQIETIRAVSGGPLHAAGACSAPSTARLLDSGQPSWCVGVYWARQVPVTIRLAWPSDRPEPDIVAGRAFDSMEPASGVCREGDAMVIRITPQFDRIFLANHIPETPPAESA